MKTGLFILAAAFLIALVTGCAQEAEQAPVPELTAAPEEVIQMTSLKLTSTAFQHNGDIPAKYTCQGDDISPPLTIEGIPEGTKTLVLIMDDPDAPAGIWDHWIEYDIAPLTEIPEDAGKLGTQGKNSGGRTGYAGPCPPSGKHRYIFKLYALDTELGLQGATKEQVEQAMEGHILANTELIGSYQKTEG